MPVVLTNVAGTLDAVIIDDNFDALEYICREGLDGADFDLGGLDDKIDTFRLRRYVGGYLTNVIIGSIPELPRELQVRHGIFESNFKETGNGYTTSQYYTALQSGNPRAWEVYEQLGRPGKTFYFDFQEDGIAEPVGVAGWPPTWWEPHRFPDDQCWSKWLTVPHAAGKFYVHRPCVAKVIGYCKGTLCFSPHYYRNLALDSITPAQQFAAGMVRLGLFVDTNPLLWSDEFWNTNPNIQGNWVSFNKFQDMTFRASPKGDYVIVGEVALRGRRSYNFSLKNRRANTYGYIQHEEPDQFIDEDWEESSLPVYDGTLSAHYGGGGFSYRTMGISLHTLLWLGSSLHIEFNYGRDEPWINNQSNNEFHVWPNDVYPEYPPYGE